LTLLAKDIQHINELFTIHNIITLSAMSPEIFIQVGRFFEQSLQN